MARRESRSSRQSLTERVWRRRRGGRACGQGSCTASMASRPRSSRAKPIARASTEQTPARPPARKAGPRQTTSHLALVLRILAERSTLGQNVLLWVTGEQPFSSHVPLVTSLFLCSEHGRVTPTWYNVVFKVVCLQLLHSFRSPTRAMRGPLRSPGCRQGRVSAASRSSQARTRATPPPLRPPGCTRG